MRRSAHNRGSSDRARSLRTAGGGNALSVATRIDAPEARDAVAGGAQLVDVLPRSIFDQEHLPGAISLPLETLDAKSAEKTLDPQRAIIVYCFDQH